MNTIDLHFANASCAHCVRLVTRSLGSLEGISSVHANPASARLVVRYDPKLVAADSIIEVMERSGYPTTLLSSPVTPLYPHLASKQPAVDQQPVISPQQAA